MRNEPSGFFLLPTPHSQFLLPHSSFLPFLTEKIYVFMKYLEFIFTTTPSNEAVSDVLSMVLSEVGFESFVHTDELDLPRVGSVDNFPEAPIFAEKAGQDVFKAYIQTTLFDADALDRALKDFPLPGVEISYTQAEAEDKDWNEEWEKNYFQPIIIGDARHPRCVIAATFHKDVPDADYNVRINPQMSFGTGHHQTTAQMISRLLDDDLTSLEVLDMGCGTSILAILARMRGARHCVAVDYDEWCVKNSLENIALNHLDGIDVVHGDASALQPYPQTFDLIIANINRNILLADLAAYTAALKPGGMIYMSGFYREDVEKLRSHAETLGLRFVDERHLDNWACIKAVLA